MTPGAVLTTCPEFPTPEAERTSTAVSAPQSQVEQLVRNAQAGCAEAFEQLVALHEARIFNYLCQLTRNVEDAQDLTQVTFVKAYRHLQRFDSSHSFASWLFIIAKRAALTHFRDAPRTETLDGQEPIEPHTPATKAETLDDQAFVWNKARQLPRDQYEALWLRYVEGFSIAEAARAMGTNQVRVRVLLHRGRAKLAKILQAETRQNIDRLETGAAKK